MSFMGIMQRKILLSLIIYILGGCMIRKWLSVFGMLLSFTHTSYSMEIDGQDTVSDLRQRSTLGVTNAPIIEHGVIRDTTNPSKTRIQKLLFHILHPAHGFSPLGAVAEMESGVVVYRYNPPPPNQRGVVWDDQPLFLKSLDTIAFKRPVSWKTRVIQALFLVPGSMASWGWGPLGSDLVLIRDVPIPFWARTTLVFVFIASTEIPIVQQMVQRAGIIGNSLFDRHNFLPTKSDKRPHRTKLKVTLDPRIRLCKKNIMLPLSVQLLCRTVAGINAVTQTIPFSLLFWMAEEEFPAYGATFIGPLSLMLLEKNYEESLASLQFLAYQNFTNQYRMLRVKKDILRKRLEQMYTLLNSKNSASLVNTLYDEFERALAQSETQGPNEHVSAVSLLFLKQQGSSTFEEIDRLLAEASTTVENRESSSQADEEMALLSEAVQTAHTVPIAALHQLIEDLSQMPGITSARSLLEYLPNWFSGVAQVSRFLLPLWYLPKILDYLNVPQPTYPVCGVDFDPVFWSAVGISMTQMVVRAASEYYYQKITFLGARSFGSRSMAFWPVAWVTNLISAYPALYSALAGPRIIFDYLKDSSPVVRVLLSAALFPSEMASFFRFYKTKYGDATTNLITQYICSTEQKRAFLNQKIEWLAREIEMFDNETTDSLYNLTQGGI